MGELNSAIRDKLRACLAGEMSVKEFQRWLAPRAWNIHKSGDPSAAELANQIEHLLAEFSNGDWSEPELRSQLASLFWRAEPQKVRASTSSAVVGSQTSLFVLGPAITYQT